MGRKVVKFSELENVLGCTHASIHKANTLVRYDDRLDDSCRTGWVLLKYAQSTGDPKLVSIELLNSDANMLLAFKYSRGEHLSVTGGLLQFVLSCPISYTFCCFARPEYTAGGPMLSGGTISM